MTVKVTPSVIAPSFKQSLLTNPQVSVKPELQIQTKEEKRLFDKTT